MKYDFETLIDRSRCGSGKWDGMREKKADLTPGVVPFSVADVYKRQVILKINSMPIYNKKLPAF